MDVQWYIKPHDQEFEGAVGLLPTLLTACPLSSSPRTSLVLSWQTLAAKGDNPWASEGFLLHPGLSPATSPGLRHREVLLNQTPEHKATPPPRVTSGHSLGLLRGGL